MPAIAFHRKKLPTSPKRPKKKINWKAISGKIGKWFVLIAAPVALGMGVYFTLFSSFFTIDFVDVHYDPGVDASRVRSLIFDQMDQQYLKVLPQKNIIFFDEEAAKKRVWEAYALDKLVIEKQYPKTLNITVVGAPFAVAWLSGGKWYHVEGKGMAVREIDGATLPLLAKQLQEGRSVSEILKSIKIPEKKDEKKPEAGKEAQKIETRPESEQSVIPMVVNTANEEVHIGSPLLTEQKVAFIIALREKLKSIAIPLLFVKTSSAVTADMTAVTEEGWEIAFNTSDDLNKQIKKVDIILKERIKDERKNLNYIDVRFDNRVYYK